MDKLPIPCRCGQEPVVWLHDGIVLIQCQDPNCRNIEIIGQQTHRMAVSVWDEHQTQAAELARLRAELEQAPTATLRQQLAGSQSALSKVMGELAEAERERDEAASHVGRLTREKRLMDQCLDEMAEGRKHAEIGRLRASLKEANETVKRLTIEASEERRKSSERIVALSETRFTLSVVERERDEARNRSETLWRILREKINGEIHDIGRDYYEKDTRSWSQYRRKQRHNDAERGQAGKE